MPPNCRFAMPIPRSRSSLRLARQRDANSRRTNTMKLSTDQARRTVSILPSRLPSKALCQYVYLGQVEHGATSHQRPQSRQRKFFAFSLLSSVDTDTAYKLCWISKFSPQWPPRCEWIVPQCSRQIRSRSSCTPHHSHQDREPQCCGRSQESSCRGGRGRVA